MAYFKFPKVLIRVCSEKGIDLVQLLNDLGLDESLLKTDLPKIAPREFGALINRLKVIFNEEALGFKVSEQSRTEDFGVLGLSFIHSKNFEEAILKTSKYKRLISPENIDLNIKKELAEIIFSFTCDDYSGLEDVIHGGMIFIIKEAANATGLSLPLNEIHLKSSNQKVKNLFVEKFNVKVISGATKDKIVMPKSNLAMPFKFYSESLAIVLENHAQDLLKQLDTEVLFSQKIIENIRKEFNGTAPSADSMAKKLGISVRLLQKKLQDEGNSFSVLLEEMRKDEAKRLLLNQALEIGEIAFLLGYSSNAAFGRAFKKWFNTTPQVYRLKKATY